MYSTVLRKGDNMPRKPYFRDYPNYIIIFHTNGTTKMQECVGAKAAIDTYRQYRELYGDNCRLTKVVLNYGEEV